MPVLVDAAPLGWRWWRSTGWARVRLELLRLVGRQRDPGGADILLEVLDRGRAWDRQHYRRAVKQPRQRDLGRCRVVALGDLRKRSATCRKLSGRQREPRNERNPLPLAYLEHVLVRTI